MKSFYFTLLFFVFHLLSFKAVATTYYVSPAGSNSNSGTSMAEPWQTITKINTSTFIGDTILFLGGNTFTGNMGFGSTDKGTSTKYLLLVLMEVAKQP